MVKDFLYGFHSIYFAIIFRLDYHLDDYFDTDRCAFFEELNYGWRKMYLEGFDE